MIITLIINQFGNSNNGTTVTAMRFAEKLKEHGHTVKIVTCNNDLKDDYVYVLDQIKLPLISNYMEKQGWVMAKKDKKVLTDAIKNSDVVHFLVPFGNQKLGKKIADKLGVASTAAFHCQPQNITYSANLGKSKLLNKFIYKYFNWSFYRKFKHIHCPSNMIKNQLKDNNYKAKLHVISNGVSDFFKPMKVKRPEEFKDKFIVLMVGRYSKEKRQDLIIDAVKKSKYKDKIQIIFAGKGPWEKQLRKRSEDLKNKPLFKFCTQEELRTIINYSDLYIHSADIEIEAIACIEAFCCGLVPVISDSKLSATNQFALEDVNKFKAGDALDLAKRIDYFIENPQHKQKLSTEYIKYGKKFELDYCVLQLEKVFEDAINENKSKLVSNINS